MNISISKLIIILKSLNILSTDRCVMQNIQDAINHWMAILDNDIIVDENNLSSYYQSTLGKAVDVLCVLLPNTREKLIECVKIAYKFDINIFVISAGKNHGYNSSSPINNNNVVIDLRKLNKIIDYNNEFGYVEVEPGVTFEQLYTFLAEHCEEYMMSGFGGSSSASIIGNALDRGVGKGRYGHREKAAEITEILLPNGEIVDLINKHLHDDKTKKLKDNVIGLNLSPLLYQSNLAIVTKMVIYLEPIPEYLSVISFSFDDDENLPNIINSLKKLTKLKVIEPVFSVYNDQRLVIGSGLIKKRQYEDLDAAFKEGIKKLSLRYGRQLARWNSSFSMHCSCKEEAQLKEEIIKNELKGLFSLNFYGIYKDEAKLIIKKSIHNKNYTIDESEFKFLFNLGYTNNYDQQTMYWDTDVLFQDATNPINDGCGLIFFAPKIPFSSNEIKKALELAINIAKQYNMELPITFQFKTADIVYMIIPIVFNRNDNESIDKATQYYEELFNHFCLNGYLPYRWPSVSMNKLYEENTSFYNLIHKIKSIFDDKLILNQNRYLN